MNQSEFRKLFDTHFEKVRRHIYYRCGDEDLATDIAQDTFLRIWEKQITLFPGKEVALLFKIANDLFINNFRRDKTQKKFANSLDSGGFNPTPEDELSFGELQSKYEDVLARMPENQRIVFLMSRIDGFKYQEIADQLNIGIKAVEKRMTLALEYLRKEFSHEEICRN